MKYQKIGDVIILNKKDKDTADRLLTYQPNTKTIMYRTGSIFGKLRKPKLKKLAGNGTVTVHKEHGCKFKIDVSKIMWSKGNQKERVRLIDKVRKGETIVDMFAGIGYFSIPIAKKSKASRIYSVELNPVSFSYLLDNIKLNKTRKIKPINADSSRVKIPEKADRVLMGLLPSAKEYLPKAMELVKRGGFIHYHGIDGEEPEKLFNEIEKACPGKCELIDKSRVKSWSPRKWHWVLDVWIKSKS